MLDQEIRALIENATAEYSGATGYRQPLVASVPADAPGFAR